MTSNNQEKSGHAMNAILTGDNITIWEDRNFIKPQTEEYHSYAERVRYTLKSNPEREIRVPPEYAFRAEKIVEFTLDSKNEIEFINKVSQYPSLTGMYLKDTKIMDLIKNPTSLKLQDEVYFLNCHYLALDDLLVKKDLGRLTAIRNAEFFKKIYESLK